MITDLKANWPRWTENKNNNRWHKSLNSRSSKSRKNHSSLLRMRLLKPQELPSSKRTMDRISSNRNLILINKSSSSPPKNKKRRRSKESQSTSR